MRCCCAVSPRARFPPLEICLAAAASPGSISALNAARRLRRRMFVEAQRRHTILHRNPLAVVGPSRQRSLVSLSLNFEVAALGFPSALLCFGLSPLRLFAGGALRPPPFCWALGALAFFCPGFGRCPFSLFCWPRPLPSCWAFLGACLWLGPLGPALPFSRLLLSLSRARLFFSLGAFGR